MPFPWGVFICSASGAENFPHSLLFLSSKWCVENLPLLMHYNLFDGKQQLVKMPWVLRNMYHRTSLVVLLPTVCTCRNSLCLHHSGNTCADYQCKWLQKSPRLYHLPVCIWVAKILLQWQSWIRGVLDIYISIHSSNYWVMLELVVVRLINVTLLCFGIWLHLKIIVNALSRPFFKKIFGWW